MPLLQHLPGCPQARQAEAQARGHPRVTSPSAHWLLAPVGHQLIKLILQTRMYQSCKASAFVSEEEKPKNILREAALSPPCIQLIFSYKSP